MKKFLVKFSIVAVLFATLTSCDEDKVIFDSQNGPSLAGLSVTSLDLPVSAVGVSFATVVVDVSTVSNVDRAIVFSVDESSTAEANQYSIDPSSLIIPAGSYNGLVKIIGDFDNVPESGSVLNLTLVSVDGAVVASGDSQIKISIARSCPVAATFAVGSYVVTQLTPGLPAAGEAAAFLEGGTVQVSVGANEFQRKFTAKAYPSAGLGNPATPFVFQLTCGSVNVSGSYATGIGCEAGNPIVFTAGTVASTYNTEDDSVIEITFTEDTNASCDPSQQTTIKLTKVN